MTLTEYAQTHGITNKTTLRASIAEDVRAAKQYAQIVNVDSAFARALRNAKID